MTNSTRTPRLALRGLSFDRVDFELVSSGTRRPVVVRVGSGTSWREATRFPSIGSDAMQSTGDEDLDATIRERAAEELVRLDAATSALKGRWVV